MQSGENTTVINVSELACQPHLHAISFTVRPGEVVAIAGSEDGGRIPLLRVLTGRQAPTGGQALLAGHDCQASDLHEAIGVVGADWGVYGRLTVKENLQLFARLRGVADDRIPFVIQPTELGALTERRTERLRPGELARLRLAIALLHDPPVLILDEPLGNVDRESAGIVRFTIGEAAEKGKAVLVATFGDASVLSLASRVFYMEDGKLLDPGVAEPAYAPAPESGMAPPLIAARVEDRVLLFAAADVRYACTQEKSVYVVTSDGKYPVTSTLAELEERLALWGFYRAHRAYLVNLAYVREVAAWTRDSYSLVLQDGQEVPLSKHRSPELRQRLGL